MQRHKFHLYINAASLDRSAPYHVPNGGGLVNIGWQRKVHATTRTEAVEKCLDDIGDLIDQITDPTIKFVSVFCGFVNHRVGSPAQRLAPIQIDVKTKKIRIPLK